MKQLFTILFLLSFVFLNAVTINVPADQPTIQAGIDAATNADTVLVQQGTYYENINYNGKLITVGSLFLTTQDPAYISSTIIDGNSIGSVVSFFNGENLSAVLCGFSIKNGYAAAGGGIVCYESSPSIKNVIISDNIATTGGDGIMCYESSSNFINVTITNNSASNNGGGIFCSIGSNLNLINSILWNNSTPEISIVSGSVTVAYSDIEGGWTGTGNIDSDPLFAEPGIGDYHLQSSSPCIDTGHPASPLDPDGTITDMGAYYFHQHYGPVWHISTTGSDITGDGSELHPFATIQHGIDTTTDTDTVLVQPGTYHENINYNGKIITVGSLFLTTHDTTYVSSTIIDGNSSGSVVTFENAENSSTVLSGFTITNGSAQDGGGVYCNFANPKLERLTISGNSSSDSGSGIYCNFSSPSLENVTIADNHANVNGGGVYCYYGSNPSLENVTITSNYAHDYGGGVHCGSNSNPSLENVTITGNTANDYGGGISCSDSNPSLENVTITGNTAFNHGGGAYFYDGSSPILVSTIIWNDSPNEIYCEEWLDISFSNIENGWAGVGNIDEDPLFVDPSNGNYNLQPASPCIDTGTPDPSYNDPDGTRADMGAYYYDQILNPIPPIADFSADTINGYVTLTVNVTDISTQGTGAIDEWYWDFGDENNSLLQNPSNEYLLPGIYTISLMVTDVNDSTDTEIKIDYITVYGTDPPAEPTNVQINISGDDAIITWTVVDTTIYGDPCVIDGYVVRYNETGYSGDEYYYFLAFTADTIFTHEFVAQYSTQMFYQVIAIADISRDEIQYLKGLNDSHPKTRWSEVKRNLKKGNSSR